MPLALAGRSRRSPCTTGSHRTTSPGRDRRWVSPSVGCSGFETVAERPPQPPMLDPRWLRSLRSKRLETSQAKAPAVTGTTAGYIRAVAADTTPPTDRHLPEDPVERGA